MNPKNFAHVVDRVGQPIRDLAKDNGQVEARLEGVRLKPQGFFQMARGFGRSARVFHERAAEVVMRRGVVGIQANHGLEMLNGFGQAVRP